MDDLIARGTLAVKEPHPASRLAMEWLTSQPRTELMQWQEAFSSCAIEGNRLGEICSETLRRILDNEPVSDRYLLGLVWAMRPDQAIAALKAHSSSGKP